mgnify:CR=1 FL=1
MDDLTPVNIDDIQWEALCELLAKIGMVSPRIPAFGHVSRSLVLLRTDHYFRDDIDADTQVHVLWTDVKGERRSHGFFLVQFFAAVALE